MTSRSETMKAVWRHRRRMTALAALLELASLDALRAALAETKA